MKAWNSMKDKVSYFWFKQPPKISTYLYAIIAGKYGYVENEHKEGFPPMRIYARKSLLEDVKKYSGDMFKWTEIGITFYNDLFGAKYPFGKYD